MVDIWLMRVSFGEALITFLAHDMKVSKSGWVTVHMVRSSFVNNIAQAMAGVKWCPSNHNVL